MKNLLTICGFLILSILLACSSDSEVQTGRIAISITDAPFPTNMVEEANVTITKVEIRKSGETDGESFTTLYDEEVSLNLLDLTNGVKEQLVDTEIEVGAYDLIRLYVSEASLVLNTGDTFNVKVPSGAQTGIKVFVTPSIEVDGGLSEELLLDFDVSKSFVLQGNINTPAGINGFSFKPVIKASNLSTAGRLTGEVTNETNEPLEGAEVAVYVGDTLNTTTFSGTNGEYAILGLDAGTYKVFAAMEGYVSSDTTSVTIVSGNKTSRDFVLTEE